MKKVKKNLFYNILYQLLIVLLPLITTPYITRTLGPTLTGIYSYNYSIAHYFVIFAMLGISTYGNRLIASSKNDKEQMSKNFWSLFSFHAIISVICLVVYIGYFLIFNVDNWNIVLIMTLYVFSALFDISWFFFGIEEFKTTVIRNTIVKLISFSLVFIFVKTENDLWIYTLIMAGSFLVSQLVLWPFLYKRVQICRISFSDIKKHIKPNLILFLPVIATSIFTIMDKIMLGNLSNATQVSFYDNSEKIIDVPKSIIRAMGIVMVPATTVLISEGKKNESLKAIEKTMLIVMAIAFPMCFGLIAIAPTFAPLYFGEKFFDCGLIIQLLSPALIFSVYGNVIRTQYFIPNSKDKEYVITLIGAAFLNIVVNLIFIRQLGAVGAVIGTLVSELFLVISQSILSRKELVHSRYIKNGLYFLIASTIMLIGCIIIGNIIDKMIFKIIVQIIVGIIIYSIFLVVYILFSKNELVVEFKRKLILNYANSIKKNKDKSWQILRALCIIAVIIIHCDNGALLYDSGTSEYNTWLIIRGIVNFAVPVFIFISGYFTDVKKIVSYKVYLKKRIARIMIPYVIWSFIYMLKNILLNFYNNTDIVLYKLVLNFFTGEYQMYYLLVMLQLTLLTPLIVKILKSGSKLLYIFWCITPLYLVYLYIFTFINNELPFLYQTLFPLWIGLYIFGMYLRYNENLAKKLSSIKWINIILCLGIIFSITENFVIAYCFNLNVAFSCGHFKFGSLIYSVLIILFFMNIRGLMEDKHNFIFNCLVKIGDNSFGMFIIHTWVLIIIRPVLKFIPICNIWHIYFLLTAIIVVIFSYIIVLLVNVVAKMFRIEKLLSYIGFA